MDDDSTRRSKSDDMSPAHSRAIPPAVRSASAQEPQAEIDSDVVSDDTDKDLDIEDDNEFTINQ